MNFASKYSKCSQFVKTYHITVRTMRTLYSSEDIIFIILPKIPFYPCAKGQIINTEKPPGDIKAGRL